MTVWTAIGLMSGTSLDGIDVALLRTDGETAVERGPSLGRAYDAAFRRRLQGALETAKAIDERSERPGDLAEIERELTLRHGEAVSIGMAGALRLSGDEALREQVVALSKQAGLPVKAKGLEVDTVLDVIKLDKKRVGDTVPFVLVNAPGDVTPGHEIPAGELESAVRELLK